MKRRAKLNVAYSRDLPKQQAAGFEMSKPGPIAQAGAPTSYAGVKQVAKFLIVAAAAALSFYLVKRRLF